MENTTYERPGELSHHGTKGMRWGVRRYQNKDGSLTNAGRKRYNKEVEKLKSDRAKLAKEKKVLENRKKTQAKFDKLNTMKKNLADKKKALKEEEKQLNGKIKKQKEEKPQETVEEKRAKLLKSNNAEELYKNRDLLTTAELNERINRIDTERRLGQIADSTKKTGMDRVNKVLSTYKKADEVFRTVNDSAIGKLIKNKLGLEEKAKKFDLDKVYKNLDTMSSEDVQKYAKRVTNAKIIKKAWEEAKEKNGNKEHNTETTTDKKTEDKSKKNETYEGTVEGDRTSKSNKSSSSKQKPADYYDPIDGYGEWINEPVSNLPAVSTSTGRSWVAGYLEDKNR